MKFSKAFQIMEQYHVNTVKDVFLMIRDLAVDYDGQNTAEGLKELVDEIKNLADVGVVLEALEAYNEEKKPADVKHGKWIEKVDDTLHGPYEKVVCSVCGKDAFYDESYGYNGDTDYCHHCGAKMEEKENDLENHR